MIFKIEAYELKYWITSLLDFYENDNLDPVFSENLIDQM